MRILPALILMLIGLVSPVLSAQPGADAVSLDVPAIKQPYNLCLAASASMVLRYWGVALSPKAIADQLPIYRDGIAGRDLQRIVEQIGFRAFLVQPPFEDLLEHLRKGRPPIVLFPSRNDSRHAVVLSGFDEAGRSLIIVDPTGGKKKSLDYKAFQQKWEAAKRWTFLIIPK